MAAGPQYEQHPDDPRHQRAVLALVRANHQGTHRREKQRPQQQAAGLATPKRADLVGQRLRGRGVVINVVETEIVAQETVDQAARGKKDQAKGGLKCPLGTALKSLAPVGGAEQGREDGPRRRGQRKKQTVVTDNTREVLHRRVQSEEVNSTGASVGGTSG